MKTTVVETRTATHCGMEYTARKEQRGKFYVWTFHRGGRERTNCAVCGHSLNTAAPRTRARGTP